MAGLTIDLFDPGMGPLHRAGLGGLAATIRWLNDPSQSGWLDPDARPLGTLSYGRTFVTLHWDDPRQAAVFLRKLYELAFGLKDGLVHLPGTHPANPPSLAVRAALQAGMSRTILPLNPSREADERIIGSEYQSLTDYAHRSAWRELVTSTGALRSVVAGARSPGQAIARRFVLVGALSLSLGAKGREGGGVLIAPEVEDLEFFARRRALLTPRTPEECQAASPVDAALQAMIRLREDGDRERLEIRRCLAVTFPPHARIFSAKQTIELKPQAPFGRQNRQSRRSEFRTGGEGAGDRTLRREGAPRMTLRRDGERPRRLSRVMLPAVVVHCLIATVAARAQEAVKPRPTAVAVAPIPSPRSRPAPTAREAELEERLLKMEAMFSRMPSPEEVGRLQSRVTELSTQVDRLSMELQRARGGQAGAAVETENPRGAGLPADLGLDEEENEEMIIEAPASAPPAANADVAGAIAGEVGEEVGFAGVASGFGPAAEFPSPRFDMPGESPPVSAWARWGPGFQIRTPDDEYDIQFHNLTQVDGRFYGIPNQKPVSDTFGLARQWFVFNGHLTRPYEYYVSFNDSFGAFDALDVFLNVNYDRRLQFMAGRFKSPYAYEFYAQPTQSLATGEWSVFFNNFGMNRDVGLMLWGESVADRIDYAAGIFNGTPNGQFDLSNPKALIAFLNLAPFRPRKGSPWENLNVGGSVVAGDQDHVPVPQELRTIVPVAGSNVLGVPFLTFNNDVTAHGRRNLWSLHAAYFYRSLTLMGEWQSGVESYTSAGVRGNDVPLPLDSFYVQASYFLTGERVASRGQLKPRRSFDLRPGKLGPGAWELVFRYADLNIGRQVFTAGLADPNLWTNQLFVSDLAVNWYWTQHLRVMFDWQHAGFAAPVIYAPRSFSKSSNLFMLRFSIWF